MSFPQLSFVQGSLAIFFAVALITLQSGCTQSSSATLDSPPTAFIEDGTAAADKPEDEVTKVAREFFVSWLESHKEENIVNDETGIGVAGSDTRLWAFEYKDQNGEFVGEIEYRIVLPDGREIVEFLAGMGETREEIIEMNLANFTLSTFHAVYSCFMNENDEHMVHEPITIGGIERRLTTSGMIAMADEVPVFDDISKQICDEISKLELSDHVHWIKVVYAVHKEEVLTYAATLDNQNQLELTARLPKLRWPETNTFYMAKQFFVIRPAESKLDPSAAK